MSKKRRNKMKNDVVFYLSPEENTLSQMPKFNGFACGHGAHGDTKYNRAKEKCDFKKGMEE